MIILSKSGVSLAQMQDRKRKGVKEIELHLIETDIDTAEKRANVINNMKEVGLEVRIVHTPIDRKFKLEGLATEYGSKIIEDSCILANDIGLLSGKDINVVIHHELNLETIKVWGIYDIILEKVDYLLKTYPNIIIDLENETVYELFGGAFGLRNSYGNQNLYICEELRKDLQTDRIGLVLDTCHAISSIRLLQHLVDEGICKPLDLYEDYFKEYSKYLDVIHLANARDYGYDDNHGIGFYTDEDMELLKEIVNYIKDIKFDGKLTLEVQEENYLDCKVVVDLYNKLIKLL